jgi:hypothetical protein
MGQRRSCYQRCPNGSSDSPDLPFRRCPEVEISLGHSWATCQYIPTARPTLGRDVLRNGSFRLRFRRKLKSGLTRNGFREKSTANLWHLLGVESWTEHLRETSKSYLLPGFSYCQPLLVVSRPRDTGHPRKKANKTEITSFSRLRSPNR